MQAPPTMLAGPAQLSVVFQLLAAAPFVNTTPSVELRLLLNRLLPVVPWSIAMAAVYGESIVLFARRLLVVELYLMYAP
ncbi:Uncharacterised protein [uncultured archaeon]|nr:Uncharacterised protein [uncultured archaeon]